MSFRICLRPPSSILSESIASDARLTVLAPTASFNTAPAAGLFDPFNPFLACAGVTGAGEDIWVAPPCHPWGS